MKPLLTLEEATEILEVPLARAQEFFGDGEITASDLHRAASVLRAGVARPPRVGIVGGSFSPFHHGHLLLARELLALTTLDSVWFLPNFRNPFKEGLIDSSHRLRMTILGVGEEPGVEVSDFEIASEMGGSTYETMARLVTENRGQNRLFFIAGTDILGEFARWRYPDLLQALLPFWFYPRSGHGGDLAGTPLVHPHHRVLSNRMVCANYSSREIRQRIGERAPWFHLVPAAVGRYIIEHNLYRNGGVDAV